MNQFELKGKDLINGTLNVKFPDKYYDNEWVELARSTIELNKKGNLLKDQWLQEQLSLVEPPIKGEITKGKLKWRGIELCSKQGLSSTIQNPLMNTTYWLEQKGKKIGVEYVEQFELSI
jgi:hypothetical protein